MFIILFSFALRCLLTYNQDFIDGECDGLASCFFYTVYRGTTYGDGLGDYLERGQYLGMTRATFDYIFFWVFSVLFFSMVSGVIIDTYGAIRDEEEHRKHLLSNFSFVSGIPAEQIDKAALKLNLANGFSFHVEQQQNKWDYAAFILSVRLKDPTEFTGLESYVSGMLSAQDHRWIPLKRCMIIERVEQLSEVGVKRQDLPEEGDFFQHSDNPATVNENTSRELIQRIGILEQGQTQTQTALSKLDEKVSGLAEGLDQLLKLAWKTQSHQPQQSGLQPQQPDLYDSSMSMYSQDDEDDEDDADAQCFVSGADTGWNQQLSPALESSHDHQLQSSEEEDLLN
jgi:hypothetical protein